MKKILLILVLLFVVITSGMATTHTSQYPPAQSDTYVKATTTYSPNYYPYFTTNPTLSLTGNYGNTQWLCIYGTCTNQRFHIDLGSAKIIRRIYYENSHNSGSTTNTGTKNFTFWGSNTGEGTFDDLVYANDEGWTQLTISQSTFDQHVALNQADPKYIIVTNEVAYRYYAFKFADGYGKNYYIGVRHIALQTEDEEEPSGFIYVGTGSYIFSGTATCYMGTKSSRALVTFCFDDNLDTQYTVMKPMFDAQGEVGVLYVITDFINTGNRLSTAQLQEFKVDGWEICSHTKSHPDLTTLSEAEIEDELNGSKEALQTLGFTVNNLADPYGSQNALVRKIARKYYRSERTVIGQLNSYPASAYSLTSYQVDDHTLLNTYKGYVDAAESAKRWLIFHMHGGTTDKRDAISELIDYIQAKGISIVTVNQALNLIWNDPDILFADGVESGDLTSWSSAETDEGKLSVAKVAALHGTYGLSVFIDDTTAKYVRDDIPTNEKRYRCRFYIDPNSLTMANNDLFMILGTYSGAGPVSFYIMLNYTTANGYRIIVSDRADNNWNKNTGYHIITDAPHCIEVDWKASSAVGANDGTFTLWIDGISKAVVTNVDSDTENINYINFGATADIDAGTLGTFFLDDFISNDDGSEIGLIVEGFTYEGTGSLTYSGSAIQTYTPDYKYIPSGELIYCTLKNHLQRRW